MHNNEKILFTYIGQHSRRVANYSVKLARVLGLSRKAQKIIKRASLLHDIGMASIPDDVLMKKMKNGPLTTAEWEVIRRHPHIICSILEKASLLKGEIPIIYYHHERWDGSGYPSGLKEKEIPLGARILAVADAYEAITSTRPYREGHPKEEAFEELKECAGSQFDPELVTIFIKTIKMPCNGGLS